MTEKGLSYAEAGVDISLEERGIAALIKEFTFKRKGLDFLPRTDIGGFSGAIDCGSFYLALTTDGVGTKILVARALNKWDTIGIDCVAMNANDLLAIGAEPVALVDYLGVNRVDPAIMAEIGKGLNQGAKEANMSIVGGETATLPDMVDDLDLTATGAGVIRDKKIITGETIEEGDAVVGIPSSGIHSNGLTLARKVVEGSSYTLHSLCPFDSEKSLGEELLTPTRIYLEVLESLERFEIKGMCHITGGGLTNLKRISNLGFALEDPLPVPPIFPFLKETGRIETREMYRTFNMGMGFALMTTPDDAEALASKLDGKVVGRAVEKGLTVGPLKFE